MEKATRYPDGHFYMNHVQSYLFRSEDLRFLLVAQFFRYFSHGGEGEGCQGHVRGT